MNIKKVVLNIQKGLIKCLKTCKLRYLIGATVTMFFVVSGDITNTLSKSIESKAIKDKLVKYTEYANIVKGLVSNIYLRWTIFFIIILIWLLIWYFRNCYEEPAKKVKKDIYILGHSTLGKSQFKLDEKAQEGVNLITEEINLIEDVKTIGENYDVLKYIVSKQDDLIKNFNMKINDNDKYGYMGISHTPLILRAGYHIGDETKFVMFHNKRNLDYYEELNNSDVYTPIKVEQEDIKENCKELIAAISTTFPIQDSQLDILQPENKSIIKFKSDELGFDVITSRRQAEEYISFILNKIRQIVRDKGIVKIHMVISSSVGFTFALGQGLSSHYDPEIIIYHFDINNPKKYPWGISLFKDYKDCIIVN